MGKKKEAQRREVTPEAPVATAGGKKAPLLVAGVIVIALAIGAFLTLRRGNDEAVIAPAHTPDDIIIVTIDTLRFDAVGFSGNRNVETPFLDSLARDGKVFTNAHAHNVVTLASHANILTGLLPYQHGVRENAGFRLDAKQLTLAERLKEKGFATGAFVGAFAVDARYGLNQGFDVYDDKYPEGSGKLDFVIQERPAAEVLKPAAEWWRAQTGQKRFMWVHLYDPHAPYQPPAAFARKYFSNPYLGEVASTDAVMAEFLAPILRESPNALLIITADHGESLGEHGEETHGLFAYEATLKVPLIVHQKGAIAPGEEKRQVRHIDIVPTILGALGLPADSALPGESLLDVKGDRDTYFEALSASINRGWAPLVGMIQAGKKYIDLPLAELYDLAADPRESNNILEKERRTVFAIRKLLADAAPVDLTKRSVSAEEGAKLLSLGYITGAAAKKSYTVEDDPKKLVGLDTKLHKIIEYYQLGQIERSIATAKEVVDQRPDMELAREMYSLVLQQSERTDAAIETLREAVRNGSATDSTKRRLGMILSETGRAKEAVSILAPLASSEDPEVLNAYGIALADSGDLRGSIREFERVLTIDKTNATAFQNLGIVALRAREVERSRKYLMQALELNPELPLALNTLGVLYAQTGRSADAVDTWKKAINADPRQYDAMYNLALVAASIGRRDEARLALEKFVATAPSARYAADIAKAKAMLRQL